LEEKNHEKDFQEQQEQGVPNAVLRQYLKVFPKKKKRPKCVLDQVFPIWHINKNLKDKAKIQQDSC